MARESMPSSSEDKVQVLVIGLGALGTIYSHILENSGQCQVTAIARSNFRIFDGPGVTIRSLKFGTIERWKPFRVLQAVEEATDRQYAYVVVCTKALPEFTATSDLLGPLLSSQSRAPPCVVLIQNGLGIEKPLRDAYPDLTIISCCAWIGAHFILKHGFVEHGSFERIDMGVYTQERRQTAEEMELWSTSERAKHESKQLAEFASYVRDGGGDAVEKEEIQIARWHKTMWNATVAVFCCLSRSPVSSVVSEEVIESTLPALRRTMLEVLYVARNMDFDELVLPARVIDSLLKLTIKTWGPAGAVVQGTSSTSANGTSNPPLLPLFPTATYHATSIDPSVLQTVGHDFRPRMLIDFETNRPAELEAVLGSVLDRARTTGTDTPRLDLLYSLMKIKHQACLNTERSRLEKELDPGLSPRSIASNFTSPRADKVRGRPVFTPAIEADETFEKAWPSLV